MRQKQLTALLVLSLLIMNAVIGVALASSPLEGSWETDSKITKTIFTFDKDSDSVLIQYFFAGMEVYKQEGKYELSADGKEISFSLPLENEAGTSTGEYIGKSFLFEQKTDYIKIGSTLFIKSEGASE